MVNYTFFYLFLLRDFLVTRRIIQDESRTTIEQLTAWISELNIVGQPDGVSYDTFEKLMTNKNHNQGFNSNMRRLYQDMTHPLSHYFIASSHNTYLTEGQLQGQASAQQYIEVLEKGFRCVEIDIWDGKDNEGVSIPVVVHGGTLVTHIPFQGLIYS